MNVSLRASQVSPRTASVLFFRTASLLCFSLLAACGDNQAPEDATATWTRIQQMPYRSLSRAPGYETRRASTAAHGDAVDIFIGPTTKRALGDKALTQWPEGTLIVKDGYDEGELRFVAVMEKRAAGWFFAEYDAEGNAKYSGSPSLCVDCHRAGSDFVRAFSLPAR